MVRCVQGLKRKVREERFDPKPDVKEKQPEKLQKNIIQMVGLDIHMDEDERVLIRSEQLR